MLKKFPSDKINFIKNALIFLSWVPIHQSFTFNSRFLYELKHKVHLSKSACGIFHFRFRLVFFRHSFPPRPLIFKLQQEATESRSVEQHMTLPKISLQCILKPTSQTAIRSKLTSTNRKTELSIVLWLIHFYVNCREKTSNRTRSEQFQKMKPNVLEFTGEILLEGCPIWSVITKYKICVQPNWHNAAMNLVRRK